MLKLVHTVMKGWETKGKKKKKKKKKKKSSDVTENYDTKPKL